MFSVCTALIGLTVLWPGMARSETSGRVGDLQVTVVRIVYVPVTPTGAAGGDLTITLHHVGSGAAVSVLGGHIFLVGADGTRHETSGFPNTKLKPGESATLSGHFTAAIGVPLVALELQFGNQGKADGWT